MPEDIQVQESENKGQEEKAPSLTLEGAQAAVITEILGKFVTPSEMGDLASITLLEASGNNEYEKSTTFVQFHKYGNIELSGDSLSREAMDRLVAAWIKWRIDHYTPPVEDDGGLAEIDDHPF